MPTTLTLKNIRTKYTNGSRLRRKRTVAVSTARLSCAWNLCLHRDACRQASAWLAPEPFAVPLTKGKFRPAT